MVKKYMNMKRCSASFLIREMHLFIHFLAISVPAPPFLSILLLSYFSFFTMISIALSQSGGAAVLWNIRGGSPNYLLNFHFHQNLPSPRQHGAIMTTKLREGWQSMWYLVLPLIYHHHYLLIHCAQYVIYNMPLNPYSDSMEVRIFIFFYR